MKIEGHSAIIHISSVSFSQMLVRVCNEDKINLINNEEMTKLNSKSIGAKIVLNSTDPDFLKS